MQVMWPTARRTALPSLAIALLVGYVSTREQLAARDRVLPRLLAEPHLFATEIAEASSPTAGGSLAHKLQQKVKQMYSNLTG